MDIERGIKVADNNQKNQVEDVNRLRQVRRDKLAELQAAGKDPFQIVKYDQTHHTKDIRDNFESLEFVPPVDEEGKALLVELSDVPAEKVVSILTLVCAILFFFIAILIEITTKVA